MCEHNHNTLDHFDLPEYVIDEKTKTRLTELAGKDICVDVLKEIQSLIDEDEQCIIALFDNGFIVQLLKYCESLVFPLVKQTQELLLIVRLIESIAVTKQRNLLFFIDPLSLLTPIAFSNEVTTETTQHCLNIYNQLIYDNETIVYAMCHRVFPIIMIWLECGSVEIQEICSVILLKVVKNEEVTKFICGSDEKIKSFNESMKSVDENSTDKTKDNINEVLNILHQINNNFDSKC